MKKHFLAIAFAVAAVLAFTPALHAANVTPVNAPFSKVTKVTALAPLPISGTNAVSSFTGTFDIQKFVTKSGQIFAVGTLSGTLTNLLTGVTQTVNQLIQIPVTSMSGSCQILHLELGPIDLDLLGLQVHLDKVVLDITAQSGNGQLLGNLLCAVANLLNGGGALTSVTKLLNQILGIL